MRMLDVAAGHGLYGIAFARQNPNASVVASDWANVLTVAQDNARNAGVQNRHTTIPGSTFDVDWGGGYDVVLLTNFLHHFNADENERLLTKVYASLKPGGRAVALEFVPDSDRITPPTSAAFAIDHARDDAERGRVYVCGVRANVSCGGASGTSTT